jgi:hypothetical protein
VLRKLENLRFNGAKTKPLGQRFGCGKLFFDRLPDHLRRLRLPVVAFHPQRIPTVNGAPV